MPLDPRALGTQGNARMSCLHRAVVQALSQIVLQAYAHVPCPSKKRIRTEVAEFGPKVAELAPSSPTAWQSWYVSGQFRSTSPRTWPKFAKYPKCVPMCVTGVRGAMLKT